MKLPQVWKVSFAEIKPPYRVLKVRIACADFHNVEFTAREALNSLGAPSSQNDLKLTTLEHID